jgi:hypothetical protein
MVEMAIEMMIDQDGVYQMVLVIRVRVSMLIFQLIWLSEILFVRNFGINHYRHFIDIPMLLQSIVLSIQMMDDDQEVEDDLEVHLWMIQNQKLEKVK